MGPAWFWPGGQPRIAALITRLGLAQFDQFFAGDLIYEDETGRVQPGKGLASMQGSFRLRAVDNPKLEAIAMLPLLEGAQLAARAEENLDCSTMPYAF